MHLGIGKFMFSIIYIITLNCTGITLPYRAIIYGVRQHVDVDQLRLYGVLLVAPQRYVHLHE